MPTWGELLNQIRALQAQGNVNALDIVRRDALSDLSSYTGRNVILYASAHLQKQGVPPELLSITNEDIEGFMEVMHGLSGDKLDIIIHSPGGRVEATEAIVKYVRSKFSDIRIIVPHEAMSAATMLACAGDRVVMGRHSFMGPIDPQFLLTTSLGAQSVPAQAILDQFDRAKRECLQDRNNLAVWVPSLQQYGPALLQQCENALALSKKLVAGWLSQWMFKKSKKRKEYAEEIANRLADHKELLTHGRPLDRKFLKNLRMKVDFLELDQQLQDKVLTAYHATMHTFTATPATKIIENQLGRAFIKQIPVLARQPGQQQAPQQPAQAPSPPQAPSPQPPQPPQAPSPLS